MPVTVSPQPNPVSERHGDATRADSAGAGPAATQSDQDSPGENGDRSASEVKRRRVEERREEDDHEAEGEEGQEAPQNGEGSAEEVRVPKTPPDPGKPTARERAEHMVLHYPYRSWCRHCARGRGCSRHHKRRSAEDREFSKGRVPTLSFDHCFLGAEGD